MQPVKKWHWIIGFFVIFILVGSGIAFFVFSDWGQEIVSPHRMHVYFFNPSQGRLEPEVRPWPEGDVRDWLYALAWHLESTPVTAGLNSTWPQTENGGLIVDMLMSGDDSDVLVVYLTDDYFNMPPLEESLFRSAFTLTMVGMAFIDSVKFVVNTEDGVYTEWVESAATIANNPSITPARLSNVQFTLYFIDESMEGLVTEIYDATNVDIQQRGLFALQQLIEGPQMAGSFTAIPSETRIRDVTPDVDAGGIYVNLSSEFVTNFSGTPAQARLMIYSIVNTVVYNTPGSFRRVFFLVDSERLEQFHGVGDFKMAFNFNERIMMGFVEEEEVVDVEV